MRRFLILPLIALSACVCINVGGVRICGNPATSTAVILAIRTHLKTLRDEIPRRRTQLHPIACGTETCYSADEVREALAKIRRDARAAFPSKALATSLTLDAELARVQDRVVVFRRASAIVLVQSGAGSSAHLVRAQDADVAFRRAQEPIDTLLAHRELNPTIRVISQPDRAQFQMMIGTNKKTSRETATQNDLESVWRGVYTGTMQKKGYRDPPPLKIDLFSENKTTVRCTLVPNTAPPNDPSVCYLEK